jgi:hypothetical protein
MDFDITDLPGTQNYYLVNLYYPKKDSSVDLKSLINNAGNTDNMILLSDKQFQNGKYHGHQKLNVSPKAFIGYTLSNISPEYYKFLSTYLTAAKPFNQLTGEPINFPSNVVNGYGFFVTTNPDIRVFDLSKW